MSRRVALVVSLLGLACAGRAEPATASAPPVSKPPAEPAGIPEDVVATVDGIAIRKAEVDIAYAQLLRARLEGGAPPGYEVDRATILDALVYSTLLRVECEKRGITDEALVRAVLPEGTDVAAGMAGLADVIDDLREAILADSMGLFTVTENDLVAAYERQKPAWTSTQPWLALDTAISTWVERTGVDACDRYVVQYRRCVTAHMPAVVRGRMNQALAESVRAWAEAAKGPDAGSLAVACSAALDAARQATSSMGCEWPVAEKLDASLFGKPPARKLAATMRERVKAPGVDFAAEAEALGLARSESTEPIPLDRVAPPLAAAAAKLKVGQVSAPIEHAGAFWVVRLAQRWPAGALPFEARRPSLALELADERRRNVRAELEPRLRAEHRVVVTPTR